MSESLPALLLFGPQSEFPSSEALHHVRQELVSNQWLAPLKEAVLSLPRLWEHILKFDPGLARVPADKHLGELKHWLEHGGPFPSSDGILPNHCALPVTVLLQVTQYTRYLARLGKNPQSQVLQSVKSAGVHGFCVGLLSAVAVATSTTEDELGSHAVAALQLAVVIGAYVDSDGIYSSSGSRYRAMAVRWNPAQQDGHDTAYGIADSIPGANGIHGAGDLPDLTQYPAHSIAIVGMAGRFPGADTVDELWDLILEGRTTVEPAPVERLALPQTKEGTKWWGNFLKDPDAFDHKFFKKSSREALAWDPQQRVLLEVVYEALESAGYFRPSATSETTDYGCYIGAVMNNYYDNLTCHPATAYATVGTSRCYISGCMSHYFGWTGPSLTIDTACSSSLVALNTACRAIWSGECSRAIAGGTNIISSPFDYQNLSAAGFLSPSGQCKPFDVNADGYCRGEAVAVVVVKPLADALRENDNILGVITGCAANQNHNFSHITAPHSGSQVDLYKKVMQLSGVVPEDVSYVEAHGTGTGVGDPIEVRSIRDAFGGPQRDSILHFASLKGNIGHTEATAGIAGLIKVLLMMKNGKIPAQASHTSVNPKIPAFDRHQMAIPRGVMPWIAPSLLACVNSYGAAGSNSAVIVRQPPSRKIPRTAHGPASKFPIIITAATPKGVMEQSSKLLEQLQRYEKANSANLVKSFAYALADRANHSLPHALASSVGSLEGLKEKLQAASAGTGLASPSQDRKPVVLVFGGQESNFVGLSKDVYDSSKIFRQHLDSINTLLVESRLESFYPWIFESRPAENLVTLHSALFAVQYASAKSWIDCGLNVSAVVGHSFGQLTALCISGVLSLPDALKLVTGRASLMQTHWGPEAGSMLFLQASRHVVKDILQPLAFKRLYAEIACYNGPESQVIVGSDEAIQFVMQHVRDTPRYRDSVRIKKLNVTNGFHSSFTEPMLLPLSALAKQLDWMSTSDIHIETTGEIESSQEPNFNLIAKHTREPVFFQNAIERLVAKFAQCTWIEAGRGSSVMQLVKACVADKSQSHTFLCPQLSSSNAETSLVDTTTDLWKQGYAVQYWPFHRTQSSEYEYFSLPPMQFEKTRHWLGYRRQGLVEDTEKDGAHTEPESHSLLSVIQKGGPNGEAVFQIDPKSERFQKMLGGHVMAGQTLAPASLYFEVAARAALLLADDVQAAVYVPTVDNLSMRSPIGRDVNKKIRMTMKLAVPGSNGLLWSFSITTQDTEGHAGEPFEHSTGTVKLRRRDDTQSARAFQRFQTLAGARRYEQIVSDPTAEKMQGSHIYRAFNTVVYYAEPFHGIKEVACVGNEAAGRVRILPAPDDPADQRLCDTPMTDSFMQFAGFLVNYFRNPSMDDVFVCMEIEHIEIGGAFDPDAGDWLVYSTMAQGAGGGTEPDATADAYVFDARTQQMVMAAFGFRFSKMSPALLGRVLKSVNRGAEAKAGTAKEDKLRQLDPVVVPLPSHSQKGPKEPRKTEGPVGKRRELLQILSDVTDVPFDEIKDNTTLEDLGIDSLMATEVLNDIRSALGITIDLSTFLFFENIRALVVSVNEKMGLASNNDDSSGTDDSDTESHAPSVKSRTPESDVTPTTEPASEEYIKVPSFSRPEIVSARKAFEETRFNYDRLAESTQALGFWEHAYPPQARLVLAYVVEAFADLGVDLGALQAGEIVARVPALKKHDQLVSQLHRVLEEGKLVEFSNHKWVRTDHPLDHASAETIYHEIIGLFPQHASVNKLVRAVGSELAACLRGDKEGLQVLFGNRETKKTLEEMYEFAPLMRTPALVLGDFLAAAFTHHATGEGKFRILEIGAGTGGTTRFILNCLRSHGIDFEYVFTDLGASFVSSAAKKFQAAGSTAELSFEVLDVEEPPPPEYHGAFHAIISTNCIHATKNLEVSLRHIRQMLRDDGVLTLIEITKNMFWLDICVGLLEGWWHFQDDREHALVNEWHWQRVMKAAGFGEVAWSDGASPESKTVRLIAAFPHASPAAAAPGRALKVSSETVIYKTVGDLPIHADVYYPASSESLPDKPLPVALMIHGGSQILFSRKDIRPAQTRLLLEKGFLPVSIDYRLCPEVALSKGAMVDVCDALDWARHELPRIPLQRKGLCIDGETVVAVGWSSGGQLAMSLGWTAPARGLRPPEANLIFYAPTDYEDQWWQHPIHPRGAPYRGLKYDVLEGVRDAPIANYEMVGAWEEPIADPRSQEDARCRIVFHINWKAQTLPVILHGLPSRARAAREHPDVTDWDALPQPSLDTIRAASPRAHIERGSYSVPTFFIHGTDDDLIPWEQSRGTYQAMADLGLRTELVLLDGGLHICDLSSDPKSESWKAVLQGYNFICSQATGRDMDSE
ncbi:BcPKS19, polyketide synthase [Nemania sp. NC0429]|nr:BcPKS19, polyketide synthase [Nemania sp. NC0429]